MNHILAINGGPKTVNLDQTEALRWPLMIREDFEAVQRVMAMPNYSFYEEAYKFESEIKDYFDIKYALAMANGTAALHSALFSLVIGSGDEVIVPTYTYWASVIPILTCQAIPVFAESDPNTLNIDPKDIEKKITSRTKAILVVHLWGMPCDMDLIMEIARRHHLKVIEDAAHIATATYKEQKVGAIGDIACFSYQATKVLPAIEGGMMVTNNKDYFERAVALGHYERIPQLEKGSVFHQMKETCFGYKYRMHPLSAAMARVQLNHIEERSIKRKENKEYLATQLKDIPGVKIIQTPPDIQRDYYAFRLLYKKEELNGLDKKHFIAALQAEGLEISAERYVLMHRQPVFQNKELWGKACPAPIRDGHMKNQPSLPVTEKLYEELLALPTFPQADKALLDQYISGFKKVVENADSIKKVNDIHVKAKPDMDWNKMNMVKVR